MASLPGSGMWFSARTIGGLAGLLVGAKLSPGTSLVWMGVAGAAGYWLAGEFAQNNMVVDAKGGGL